jgi:hypothetical protein
MAGNVDDPLEKSPLEVNSGLHATASSSHEVIDQRDHRADQEDVNQKTRNVQEKEADDPRQHQKHRQANPHVSYPSKVVVELWITERNGALSVPSSSRPQSCLCGLRQILRPG